MLIAQITDIHLGTCERSQGNLDRLVRVLAAVTALNPDVVLLTGDLTEHGDADSYRTLQAQFAPLAARTVMTLGNHDRRAGYAEVFGAAVLEDGFAQGATDFGPLRIVAIDTLDEGFDTAGFCERRAAWLDATLAREPDRPTLLALHHPPVRSGVDWIDVNADGAWSRRLQAVLERHAQVVGLVAGHVHQPIATMFAGRSCVVAPSVAYAVAHDPRPLNPNVPDDRPLIVASNPGFALHRWTGTRLVSWFGTADDADVVVRFDEAHRTVVTDIAAETATHDQ